MTNAQQQTIAVLAFFALAATTAHAERLPVTVSYVDENLYHAKHPTIEVYLITEACFEVVQNAEAVLDLDFSPPQRNRLIFPGEIECVIVEAIADGQSVRDE